ncbi:MULTISPECIES: GNAT family N-acetyltransferase [unclassified Exiguobacterium]|uniref:GNAT family N-acetyltransferase n=1 Tax=unclassified Exiguobacterium TaxID=2644629 RepID=UPI001BEA2AA7|nr:MULTISPECIES: GNAT family N-acetyltransferase [unclassified Exiguobacterium]
MINIRFEPMTETMYQTYLPTAIEEYAAEKVKAGTWVEAEAIDRSTEEFRQLLPDGRASKDNYLFSLVDEATTEAVGMMWFHVVEKKQGRTAFIYDFSVDAHHQGKGYGRQAMVALEQVARRMNIKIIGLHVFAHNTRAIKLYESSGYAPTDLHMEKRLD